MGINLQSASDVIFYDASWNPQVDIQAMHRVVRIGQKNTVRIYRLFCRDSIDQRILEVAKRKLALSYILVKSGPQHDDIDEVIKFGSQDIMSLFKDQIAAQSTAEI